MWIAPSLMTRNPSKVPVWIHRIFRSRIYTASRSRELEHELGTVTYAWWESLMQQFFKNESGATAIEYGLIAALIAVTIIAAVTALGSNTSSTFDKVAEQMA